MKRTDTERDAIRAACAELAAAVKSLSFDAQVMADEVIDRTWLDVQRDIQQLVAAVEGEPWKQ